MMIRASQWMMAVMAACLVVSPAWAGWVVTYEDENADGGKEQSVSYYDGDRFRSDSGQGITIYSGDTISMADTVARAYWKGTPEGRCRAQRKMMEEINAMMPAQFRDKFRDKPISQRKVTRKKLGTRKIAGFTATGYQFYVDGKPTMGGEIWVSSEGVLSRLARPRHIGDCEMGEAATGVSGSKLFRRTMRNAFVLRSSTGTAVLRSSKGIASERKLWSTVVSVKEASIPSSKFNMPPGYKGFTDYKQFMEYVRTHQQARQSSPSRRATSPSPSMSRTPPPPTRREVPPSASREPASTDDAGEGLGVPGMDDLKESIGGMLKSIW